MQVDISPADNKGPSREHTEEGKCDGEMEGQREEKGAASQQNVLETILDLDDGLNIKGAVLESDITFTFMLADLMTCLLINLDTLLT